MKETKLGLKKPEGTDLVDINDINDNMDTIEKELQARPEKTGKMSDMTVEFEQNSSRTNIATGEKASTIMGKIKKWFADMTVAAFAQVITSNTDLMALTTSGYLADALAVKNQFSEINGAVNNIESNEAIKNSAVNSYIKSDGSYGNIEYDISLLNSKLGDFVRLDGQTNPKPVSNGKKFQTGITFVDDTNTDMPTKDWYFLISVGDLTTGCQLATNVFNGNIYWRYCSSGTWNNWVQKA